ncbi:MAG TPA: ABC transporter ATP-binding protein [Dehalococcoidia bacterium]|nr:ABC transporter ATP-binding protein [Dehalococcoidia bacterium]
MPPNSVHVAGLQHTFAAAGGAGIAALGGVTLDVAPGSFVAIVGPSGCGKSTLLRILAGLLVPSAGQASIGERSVLGRPGLAAYMPQRDALLPWRRALENATLGPEVARRNVREKRERAGALFGRFGLAGFERAWPAQLSGGMRQRLALLRTFLIDASVLLLDEPLGALDAITRRSMHQWLESVWLEDGRTTILVTHDVDEALLLADRIFVMTPRPGRVALAIDVPQPRPRRPDVVTTPGFVTLKADVLAALDATMALDTSAV